MSRSRNPNTRENYSVFKPDARHENSVNAVFDQVIAWAGVLKVLREKQA